MANQNTPAVTSEESRAKVTYAVAGQEVTLSYKIVRNFLTKGTGKVTDQDLTQFISICKYNQLNPFLNEAYLVKFGTAPAQMIVSKEALMKRAEACDKYDGIQGGIIIVREGEVVELEGCFKLEGDKLVGGWAKVYRSDRKFPVVSRVSLDEYDKKQSTWNDKKSTMISKVAKVQALREAFPSQLGAMYTADERQIEDVAFEELKKENANKTTIDIEKEPEASNPEPAKAPETKIETELQESKFETLDKARDFISETFNIPRSDLLGAKVHEFAAKEGMKIVIEKKDRGF